jgi:diguanylate cyclase (GGDEF)-like protein
MKKARILEILRKSPKFTFPPRVLLELVPLSFSAKPDSSEVVALVSTSKDEIMHVAKNSHFKINRNLSNFRMLVDALTAKNVRNILFTKWLLAFNTAGKYDKIDYDVQKQYWILSGILAETFSRFFHIGDPADFMLMGMLQDISKVAMARAVPEVYLALSKIPITIVNLELNEEKVTEIRHADISADLVSDWGFPEDFVESIRIHHLVEDIREYEAPDKAAAQIVVFSGRMAELVLQYKGAYSYKDMEEMFVSFFGRQPDELPHILRMALVNAKLYAQAFSLKNITKFSGLRVLKDNPEFLKSKIIPYEEMLEELVEVYEQVEQLETELEQVKAENSQLQVRDALTGLCNHAYFQEVFAVEVAKANRYEYPISLIIFDIDNFRLFNQAYGFSTGNAVLREISEILLNNLRESDIIARYGDDAFAIVIPQAARVRATVVSEKLRKRIEENEFANPHKDAAHKITVSVGFTTCDPKEIYIDRHQMLKSALQALAMAQKAGGNCCKSTIVTYSYSVNEE